MHRESPEPAPLAGAACPPVGTILPLRPRVRSVQPGEAGRSGSTARYEAAAVGPPSRLGALVLIWPGGRSGRAPLGCSARPSGSPRGGDAGTVAVAAYRRSQSAQARPGGRGAGGARTPCGLSAGLYYLAELIEEYTVATSRIIKYMIWEHISGEIVNLAGAVTTSSVVPALPQGSLGYTPPLNSEQTLLRCLPDLAAGAGLEPRTSLEARQSQDWEAERQQPQPGLSGT
ncbi:protein TEX261 isoform X4 [Manis javanica]|uniref:protein TEX261 isoform X2 n=1 Tax=Manis javanica TaxID=9974 RepID=UPI003C6D3A98